jgi:ABC-type Fe3+/spermidine/putrescine transport system ATPase subunit
VPAGLTIGDPVQLIVRPEALAIARNGTAPLRATVISRTFLGEKIEYVVRCAGATLQTVRYSAGPGDVLPEGSEVSVRIAEGAVSVLPGKRA